jgi:hypothetical protein
MKLLILKIVMMDLENSNKLILINLKNFQVNNNVNNKDKNSFKI